LDLSAVDPSAVLERSNVALEKEIPELIIAVYGFRANLKTVQAQDDILGRLLDTIA
jgi:flagellar hook protein FlgE